MRIEHVKINNGFLLRIDVTSDKGAVGAVLLTFPILWIERKSSKAGLKRRNQMKSHFIVQKHKSYENIKVRLGAG
jgi:hypothetical protein